MYATAVTLVGYSLAEDYWIAKLSWGASFADGGFVRIAFGSVSIAAPAATYGLQFDAWDPLPPLPERLTPVPGRPGCFKYAALPSDFVSKVAVAWGISVQTVLLDNRQVLSEVGPDAYLDGVSLTLCGVSEMLSSPLPSAPPPAANAPGANMGAFTLGTSHGWRQCGGRDAPNITLSSAIVEDLGNGVWASETVATFDAPPDLLCRWHTREVRRMRRTARCVSGFAQVLLLV